MRSAQPTIRRTASEFQTCRLQSSGPCTVASGRLVKGCLLCTCLEALAGLLSSQIVRVLCLPAGAEDVGRELHRHITDALSRSDETAQNPLVKDRPVKRSATAFPR